MYDELKERCRACSQGCIYPSECSYFDKPPLRCMRQLLSEAADAIEELTALSRRQEVELVELTGELASKPRWIPVSERLIRSGWYLVACNEWGGSAVRKAIYDEATRKWLEFPCGGPKNITKFVTHYMPLPEPPKEET